MAGVKAEQFIAALREIEDRSNVEPMGALYAADAETSNAVMAEPDRGVEGATHFWT
jgi:hypothetical protein